MAWQSERALSWLRWLLFEKPCCDAEKNKDRNNHENNYLGVNFTAQQPMPTE
jgi:hypothetical protein